MIGSGIAGLSAALTAAQRGRVALITKGALSDGCTRWAQGGFAAALGDDDSPALHAQDTIEAGRGLCDPEAVRLLTESAAAAVQRLTAWGVRFDRATDGRLALGREAAHSCARIVHAQGDATGWAIESTLAQRVIQSDAVDVFEGWTAVRLLVDEGRCRGVECADSSGRLHRIHSAAVVLATGGAGQLWLNTTNPEQASGDGVALAWEAGADVASMEFVQFHPTALNLEGAPHFLISEAVRGEGGQIVNARGERFLLAADPRGELAPRDIVSRTIWQELQGSDAVAVYLDCSPFADRAAQRFPTITATLREQGIDFGRDLVPIAPAAHYLIGGVRTDLDGATSIPGLFACGEVASTGVHGANRLASNSLLEGAVLGPRAAEAALRTAAESPGSIESTSEILDTQPSPEGGLLAILRAAMWRGAGIVRDAEGLGETLELTRRLQDEASSESSLSGRRLQLAAICAGLVCEAALNREESRGTHFRSDHPNPSDQWPGVQVMHRERGTDRGDHT